MDNARAQQVLARIDEILRWEQRTDKQKDRKRPAITTNSRSGNRCDRRWRT